MLHPAVLGISGASASTPSSKSCVFRSTIVFCAFLGATVYLACKNTDNGNKAAEQIMEKTGVSSDHVPVVYLDLSKMKTVKDFVYDFKRRKCIVHSQPLGNP